MMHRYSEVLNLPVICADSGKKAGIIKDVIFSPQRKEVKAFLLGGRGLSLKRSVIFIGGMLSLGGEAAVINDDDCISRMDSKAYSESFCDKRSLIGLKIYSRAGGELGIVKDIIFDYQTGKIEAFEISDGILQDVMLGRKLLPLFGKVELGEEFAVVGREALEEMEDTGGGIKNKLLK